MCHRWQAQEGIKGTAAAVPERERVDSQSVRHTETLSSSAVPEPSLGRYEARGS